ncbi:MAG: type II secretion system protein M [Wenzhouxiangellaceae bacterium]|nr:type II secretion system protein M [Wenzhouxiangellaceae bacterium]MBS3747289.1 type II secretion system protein M [Wenzhouxiangellaceae bacterium]MBS3823749.1 type II secretion system protein M [Wenzhouxiangellaceae bacterium]
MIAYWRRLQPRERGLIGVAALVVAAVLAWTLVWEPLQEARESLADRIAAQRALLDWLDRVAPEVDRLRERHGAQPSLEGGSTLSVIDQGARAAGLAGALKRIEPGNGDEVRVVFDQAPFPDLMRWLGTTVAERPLAVARITADRAGPGRVDSVVVLRRTDVGND